MLEELDRHLARTDLARALPQRAYSDPEVFEAEMERIFRNEWLAICGSDELREHGDYLALRIADEPVVAVRGADGELRAFANVCRHRGTLLYPEGRGNARKIVCPYHAWSYDAQGALLGVPHPGCAKIDLAENGLIRLHLEVWRGIAFVHLGDEPDSLAARLSGLDERLDRYEFERFSPNGFGSSLGVEWATNWKIAFENALDWYHVFHAHSRTLEPIAPTRHAFLIEGSPNWSLTASRLAHPAPVRDDDPRGMGDFERSHYLLISIPPNLVAYATPESWGWLNFLPTAPERCVVPFAGLRTKHTGGTADAEASQTRALMDEDQALCEHAQLAMRSRRGRGGPFVELDRPISDFHHYLGWKLFDHPLTPGWRAEEIGSAQLAAAGS